MSESPSHDREQDATGAGATPRPEVLRGPSLLARLADRFVVAPGGDITDALQATVRDLGRLLGGDVAYLVELNAEATVAEPTCVWRRDADGPGEPPRFERETMTDSFDPLLRGEAVRIDDVAELDAGRWLTRRELARRGVGAMLWLPMAGPGAGEPVVGWFGCETLGRPHAWSDAEVDALTPAVDVLGRVLIRRRVEAQLAFHLDNVPLGMLQWDGRLRLQRWSALATELFGWTFDEVVGRDWSQIGLVHPEDAERVERTAYQLIHSERRSNTSINRNVTKDGRELTCEWFNSALVDQRGRPVSVLSFVRDVTERQRMRDELQASRGELQRLNVGLERRIAERTQQLEQAKTDSEEQARMLRVTLDGSPDHNYLFDATGRCVFISRATYGDLGEVAASLLNRLPHESQYPAEIIEQFLALWSRLEAGEPMQNAEVEIDTTRGRRRFDYSLVPVRRDGGELISAVLSAHDITDRAATVAALRESEVRYRELAEHATDLISRHDRDGRFTYVSPACTRLLGCSPDELIGTLPRYLAHPEDRQLVIDSLPRLKADGDAVRTVFRALRRDGSTVWLEAVGRDTGQELVVVTRDISARRETQSRLRLIESAVEQVADAVIVTGPDIDPPGPRIVYVNRAFCRLTGYEPHEVIGRTPRLLQGPRSERDVLAEVREALAAGEPFSGETTNYRKDGSAYIVEWRIAPLHDGEGHLTHWVSIQRDITERVEAEAIARQHREEVAHVGRLLALGQMASGVAHEINQPLTAISNYVGGCLRLLTEDRDRDEVIHAMRRVAGQIEKVKSITGQPHRLRVQAADPSRLARPQPAGPAGAGPVRGRGEDAVNPRRVHSPARTSPRCTPTGSRSSRSWSTWPVTRWTRWNTSRPTAAASRCIRGPRGLTTCWWRSMTAASACRTRTSVRCSSRSIRRKRRAWAWAFRSAGRSWTSTRATCGRCHARTAAASSRSACPPTAPKWRTPPKRCDDSTVERYGELPNKVELLLPFAVAKIT